MLSRLAPAEQLDLNLNLLQVPPGPPSPTFSTSSFMSSVSWMAEKTSSELIPLLKNAYSALKDKEKDLMLAAELGKSLLEHNMKLKSSYDSLLKLNTPPITPSSSTNTVQHLVMETNEEETMQFIPSRTTREAMLEVLKTKNTELTAKLEQAMQEQENISRSNQKKTRQLEDEISFLKSNLDIASLKISELQEMNAKQKKLEVAVDPVNEELVDELYTEIHKMKQERDLIVQSKQDVESKLTNTLKDLSELKKQFEQFEFTQHDFDRLQDAYESQYSHIQELNQSLEEHRTLLQKVKEKSIATPSTYEEEPEHDYAYRKNTLLQELESGWLKSNSSPSIPLVSSSPLSSSPSEDMFHLRDFKQYNVPSIGFESVLSKATGMDQNLLDETLDFIHKLEQEHNKEKCMALYHDFMDTDTIDDVYPHMNLYPALTSALGQLEIRQDEQEPSTLIGRVKSHIKRLFALIWKWCRFAIILTTALLINAWRGPDALLLTC